jgi:hypothetical protein
MGVQRKHVNELCNNRRAVTAPTALILARVFGNSADFWLNVQRRSDLWQAMNSPRERADQARAAARGGVVPETKFKSPLPAERRPRIAIGNLRRGLWRQLREPRPIPGHDVLVAFLALVDPDPVRKRSG